MTDFFINGTIKELPSGSGLENVSITVKDDSGRKSEITLTNVDGPVRFEGSAAGKYSIYKLKIGYTAQVDPDELR